MSRFKEALVEEEFQETALSGPPRLKWSSSLNKLNIMRKRSLLVSAKHSNRDVIVRGLKSPRLAFMDGSFSDSDNESDEDFTGDNNIASAIETAHKSFCQYM